MSASDDLQVESAGRNCAASAATGSCRDEKSGVGAGGAFCFAGGFERIGLAHTHVFSGSIL